MSLGFCGGSRVAHGAGELGQKAPGGVALKGRGCAPAQKVRAGVPLGTLLAPTLIRPLPASLPQSIIRVVFHDRRLQYTEHQQLEGWRWSRPGDRILDIGESSGPGQAQGAPHVGVLPVHHVDLYL